MLRYAAIALVIALIAFVFGFFATMVAGGAVWVAKMIFFIALLAFVVLFVMHMMKRKSKA